MLVADCALGFWRFGFDVLFFEYFGLCFVVFRFRNFAGLGLYLLFVTFGLCG